MPEAQPPIIEPKSENPLTPFSTEALAQELIQRLQEAPELSESGQTLKSALDSYVASSEQDKHREKEAGLTNQEKITTENPNLAEKIDSQSTENNQQETAPQEETKPEVQKTLEEIAKVYARLIREKGFAFLHGKFPRNLRTDGGDVISHDEYFGGFTEAGEIGLERSTSDIGILNINRPKFETALYKNKRELDPRAHYFTWVQVPAETLKESKERYDMKLGSRMQSFIDGGEDLIIYSLHSWEDSDQEQYSNVKGERKNMDLSLKFYFALPLSCVIDHPLVYDAVWRIYEELYPGIEHQLTRRPADHGIDVPEPFKYSSDQQDYRNWIDYINNQSECRRFKYSRSVGQAAPVDRLK